MVPCPLPAAAGAPNNPVEGAAAGAPNKLVLGAGAVDDMTKYRVRKTWFLKLKNTSAYE